MSAAPAVAGSARLLGSPLKARATALGLLLLLAGCAERQLVTRPESTPSAATWSTVAAAAALAAVVIGVLLTLPAWRTRSGSRLAVWVLTAHVGAVVVGGVVLAATAVRTWQLLDQPVESAAHPALLRLSAVDGDPGFYALMLLVTVVLTALVAVLLALATRWAAGEALVGRYIACAVLLLVLLADAAAAGMVVLGSRAWPYLLLTASWPLTAAALTSCWPRRSPAAAA